MNVCLGCIHLSVLCCRYEQSHFTVELSGKTGFWWIGLRAHGQGGGVDYMWDNGAPLTFTHWDREQPGKDPVVSRTGGHSGTH